MLVRTPYNKPALTYTAQLQQLKDRGLSVADDTRAIHVLENVSYYRLSAYWYPLLSNKQTHTFKKGADFDISFKLYCFDKDLRKLLLSELEKIEVAIRAKMIYILSHKHGAFWLEENSLYTNSGIYNASLSKFVEEFNKNDEEFIIAFKQKYSNSLPPSWMMLEITSFGALSMVYKNLKPSREKKAISRHFRLGYITFESWLHCIVYLRNVCAHHSRLWNKELRVTPSIPNYPSKLWVSHNVTNSNNVYFALCMVRYLLQTVNPNNSFTQKIIALLKTYENVAPNAMGFPENWNKDPLWQ